MYNVNFKYIQLKEERNVEALKLVLNLLVNYNLNGDTRKIGNHAYISEIEIKIYRSDI